MWFIADHWDLSRPWKSPSAIVKKCFPRDYDEIKSHIHELWLAKVLKSKIRVLSPRSVVLRVTEASVRWIVQVMIRTMFGSMLLELRGLAIVPKPFIHHSVGQTCCIWWQRGPLVLLYYDCLWLSQLFSIFYVIFKSYFPHLRFIFLDESAHIMICIVFNYISTFQNKCALKTRMSNVDIIMKQCRQMIKRLLCIVIN